MGLLYDKARDSATNKFKDGDLADEKLREIIVKDLAVEFRLDVGRPISSRNLTVCRLKISMPVIVF